MIVMTADRTIRSPYRSKPKERQAEILKLLEKDGQVRIKQLADDLQTTTVTVRNDLDLLEKEGLIERVPGGAVNAVSNVYNTEFQRRRMLNKEAKKAIATALLNEIEDGDTLFINGGSTTYYAAQLFKRFKKHLIIITNSISIAMELGATPTFTVILTGGQINPFYSFTCGPETLDQLRHYQVKKAVISIDGVDETGIMTIHPEESTIAKMMIERSGRSIIIADSSKVGKQGLCTICGLSQIDLLITDSDAEPGNIEKIRLAGVESIIAKKESSGL